MHMNEDQKKVLDDLCLENMCCRRMLMTHVPIIDDVCSHCKRNRVLDESKTEIKFETTKIRQISCD